MFKQFEAAKCILFLNSPLLADKLQKVVCSPSPMPCSKHRAPSAVLHAPRFTRCASHAAFHAPKGRGNTPLLADKLPKVVCSPSPVPCFKHRAPRAVLHEPRSTRRAPCMLHALRSTRYAPRAALHVPRPTRCAAYATIRVSRSIHDILANSCLSNDVAANLLHSVAKPRRRWREWSVQESEY